MYVGKSSIILQWALKIWYQDTDPTIDNCEKKIVKMNDTEVLVEMTELMWDSTQSFQMDSSFKDREVCDAYIFCYDICKPETLTNIHKHYSMVQKHLNGAKFCSILVGNKIDLDLKSRQVTLRQAEMEYPGLFVRNFEVSAKECRGIDEMVEYIVPIAIESSSRYHKLKSSDKSCGIQ